jgi:hypothetical protein
MHGVEGTIIRLMPDSDPRLVALDQAVKILVDAGQEMAYRDLIARLGKAVPGLSRHELTSVIAELVTVRGHEVCRSRPGHFAARSSDAAYSVPRERAARKAPTTGERKWPQRPLPNRVENLVRLGFRKVGHWSLHDSEVSPSYEEGLDLSGALIAYVSADSVMYIILSKKLESKSKGRLDRTIRTFLSKGRSVAIYALTEWTPYEHNGMSINVAAGLEDELIERMQPPWNGTRRL